MAECCLFDRALLQKRTIILSILLAKATPYTCIQRTPAHTYTHTDSCLQLSLRCTSVTRGYACIYIYIYTFNIYVYTYIYIYIRCTSLTHGHTCTYIYICEMFISDTWIYLYIYIYVTWIYIGARQTHG